MTFLPSLPEDLKNRLLAAGVKDEASLHAALEADPSLHDDYHQWLFQDAFMRFAEVETREELAALAEEVPLMTSQAFIDAVQQTVDKALDMGEYDSAEALRQRLNALKEIRAMRAYQRQTPLAQAVIAFVQAPTELAARRVFERYRADLDSQEAELFLQEEFEGSSEAADRHLEQRRALLRALRQELTG
jgi:excinuclease UvrABC nuclease subunit